MASLKDIRGRIASVKNIRKITRAMEMVAAARLRRAEQRIEALRPYADALRRMTRRASEAAGNIPNMPILSEREDTKVVGILLVTGRSRPGGTVQLADHARRQPPRRGPARRGQAGALVRLRAPRRVLAALPRARDRRHLDRLHRPPRLLGRAHDRRRPRRRLRGRQGRPRGDHLQRLHLGREPGGARRDAAAAPAGGHPGRRRRGRGRRGRRRRGRPVARALGLRARPRGDPRPARARLRRDIHLQGAARVDGVRARRPHERHAQRIRQRRRADRRPHSRGQPPAPGRDHAGDHGGRRRGRGP